LNNLPEAALAKLAAEFKKAEDELPVEHKGPVYMEMAITLALVYNVDLPNEMKSFV
jgi:hypothetical protein